MNYADGTDRLHCKLSFLNILSDHGNLNQNLDVMANLNF